MLQSTDRQVVQVGEVRGGEEDMGEADGGGFLTRHESGDLQHHASVFVQRQGS